MAKITRKAAQAMFDDLFSNFQFTPKVKKARSRFLTLVAGNLKDQKSIETQESEHAKTRGDMQELGELFRSLPPGVFVQKTDVYYDRPHPKVQP